MGDTNIDENTSNNGTYFKEIFSLFLGTIQDYNLKNMFIYNPEVAEDMMETFLKKSIPYFYNCQKDIKNTDNIDMECKKFNIKLDMEEKNILSDLMVLCWFERLTNNILQVDGNLQDTDFKTFSEANNLKEKSERLDRMREKVHQEINQYGWSRTSFSQWADGQYG